MGKYDTERERIYREVHDDKSRLLEAAEADIEVLKQENARLKAAVAELQSEAQTEDDTKYVNERHKGFAKDLLRLCHTYALMLEDREDGICLSEMTARHEGAVYVTYYVDYSDGSGCVMLELRKEV